MTLAFAPSVLPAKSNPHSPIDFDYPEMTEHWVDYSEKLSKQEIQDLIKSRLRACWWGARANKDIQLRGKEIGNFDMFGTGGTDDAAADVAQSKKVL